MQQTLEMLKAMRKKAEENQERIEAKIDTNQAKAAKQEEMLAEISVRMIANLANRK
jgi:hypothetical protein